MTRARRGEHGTRRAERPAVIDEFAYAPEDGTSTAVSGRVEVPTIRTRTRRCGRLRVETGLWSGRAGRSRRPGSGGRPLDPPRRARGERPRHRGPEGDAWTTINPGPTQADRSADDWTRGRRLRGWRLFDGRWVGGRHHRRPHDRRPSPGLALDVPGGGRHAALPPGSAFDVARPRTGIPTVGIAREAAVMRRQREGSFVAGPSR